LNPINANLITTATAPHGYPQGGIPEIAFVGRSNVGKSSLINALANRKALARTSQTPGKTRTINFFGIDDTVIFVDLPGYGYAKAPKSEIKSWGKMAETYLARREQLAAIIFLQDIRREPSENDKLMYEWLTHYGHKIIIAATKTDKVTLREAAANLKKIKNTLRLEENTVLIPFSAVKKTGRDELWEAVISAIS